MVRFCSFRKVDLCFCILMLFLKKAEPTCKFPYQKTDGQYYRSEAQTFYIAQSFETYKQAIGGNCHMRFIAEARALSMNVVDGGNSVVECQFFEKKASEDGRLIEKDGSTYYEKVENYIKAATHAINVGSKDDRPGTFTFQLATGFYNIRLKHLTGGFICRPDTPIAMPFGCRQPSRAVASAIRLYGANHTKIVSDRSDFEIFEGDGSSTEYIATTKCFLLQENSIYSFWYVEDFANDSREENNSGETSFEMFVQFCEYDNACI